MHTIRVNSTVIPSIILEAVTVNELITIDKALKQIKNTQTGRNLLTEIRELSTNGRSVEIHTHKDFINCATAVMTSSQLARFNIKYNDVLKNTWKALEISRRKNNHQNGEGVSTIIDYNPDHSLGVNEQGKTIRTNDRSLSYVSLFHELVHAMRFMSGSHMSDGESDKPGTAKHEEELRVIGIGKYKNSHLNENQLRNELGLPIRLDH